MRNRLWALMVIASLLLLVLSPAVGAMPPNTDKITQALIDRGQIPAGATEDEVEAFVAGYLAKKLDMSSKPSAKPTGVVDVFEAGGDANPNLTMPYIHRIRNHVEQQLQAGSGFLRGRRIGQDVYVPPAVPQQYTGELREGELLVLLGEYADVTHNSLPQPGPENNADFWTSDFSRDHYREMLFTPGGYTTPEGLHLASMCDFYLEQSAGSYTVDGDVYGWFQVSQPAAHYGDDDPEGGHDNLLPGTPRDFIRELAIAGIEAGIPWHEYDKEDPMDLDMDGDLDEPDGIVDHLVIVHAGAGQEAGGGAQGDDAIWSHSSSVGPWLVSSQGGGPLWDGTAIYNYIIQPEDGAAGVFCHEYGHDLGLPDLYDTIYSGEASPGFWSIMASGSWLGQPLGTRPCSFTTWGRMVLGGLHGGQWVQPTTIDLEDLADGDMYFYLDQATTFGQNAQAIKVNLPEKEFKLNDPYSGSWEWYSQKGDEMDHSVLRAIDLTAASTATLDFWTWYDIEYHWDYAFVQVSTDGGATWTSLETPRTTYDYDAGCMESIIANLPGYTGSSGGWVNEVIDLSAYCGQEILLQFRYMTDWAVQMTGFFADDIAVYADGNLVFFDDVETEDPAWTTHGFVRHQGKGYKPHYYMLELRNYHGSDASLAYPYNFYGPPSTVEWFNYDPGVLLWYRDMTFTENWVGEHPGQGFMLAVDAHPSPMIEPIYGAPWRSRIQVHDATFSTERGFDISLSKYGKTKTYEAKQAQPCFDDGHSYWSSKAPDNSVIVPEYGLVFRVIGIAEDGSSALVGIGLK